MGKDQVDLPMKSKEIKPLPKDFGYIEATTPEEESYWSIEGGKEKYEEAFDYWERVNNLKTNKALVEEFKTNPQVKDMANRLAFQISQEFPNWFTIPRLVKKFKVDTAEAARQIEMLMLFHLCVGKTEKNILYLRIDIAQKTRRELLLKQIEEKEGEISFLKQKLSELN